VEASSPVLCIFSFQSNRKNARLRWSEKTRNAAGKNRGPRATIWIHRLQGCGQSVSEVVGSSFGKERGKVFGRGVAI